MKRMVHSHKIDGSTPSNTDIIISKQLFLIEEQTNDVIICILSSIYIKLI